MPCKAGAPPSILPSPSRLLMLPLLPPPSQPFSLAHLTSLQSSHLPTWVRRRGGRVRVALSVEDPQGHSEKQVGSGLCAPA